MFTAVGYYAAQPFLLHAAVDSTPSVCGLGTLSYKKPKIEGKVAHVIT